VELSHTDFETRIRAAEGYVELGMYFDADAELEGLAPEERDAFEVLAVRVQVYSALKKWDLVKTVAKALASLDPDNPQWPTFWATAIEKSVSLEAAKTILLEAVERMPDEAMLHYDLARYECQLGDLEVAMARLKHALKLEPRFRRNALEDEEFEPLWNSMVG
jgi:tetratricopeptide (TPR) repeat protein